MNPLTKVAGALAVTALSAFGCSKASPTVPTDHGVNITVNAKALSSTDLGKVTVGSLIVTGDELQAKTFSVFPQIATGQLTFQYFPKNSTATTASLSFEFEALGDTGLIYGAGTAGPVTLAANAVPVTITLTPSAGTANGLGTNCTAASDCGSGFCTDGVCCQEACKADICASCALTYTKGLCAPYAENTDPDKECTGFSMATGTGGSAGKGGAGGAGGAKSDAGAPMDASASDAEPINPPDGGIMATASSCGGTCNGMKHCAFASPGTTCGKPFCNTRKDLANLVCDGKGSCGIGLQNCTSGYACDFQGTPLPICRTMCNSNTDCLAGYYCNGNDTCAQTKVDGLTCVTDAECLHNHCVSGVCCNTACASPNTCNDSGSAGTCKCPNVTCHAGVSCAVFYPDVDGDGFGDNKATITNSVAMAGCADTPPKGYVVDNTDCDDKDANAFPGQTAYFSTVSAGTGSFDYNCDGTFEKGVPEYPGASCSFCPDGCSIACTAASATTCGAVNTKASLNCTKSEGVLCSILVLQPANESTSEIAAQVVSPPITKLPPVCCGCAASDEAGFNATVACGQAGNYVTCGSCTAAMGGVVGTTTSGTVKQTCH